MKAVVLEVRGDEAAILTMDGTVRRVRGHYQVGQEMEYAAQPRFSALRWVAAALVAAILLTASAGLWIGNNYVACAEVSLDVNPSIVYTLNRRSRVLSVSAVNEEAAPIVEAIGQANVRFAPIEDAVERTLDILEDKGYLDQGEENYVLAGVSADDKEIQNDLAGRVEAVMARPREGAASVTCQVERTDRATARQAKEKGMSPGRYAAWRESGDDREPEDFAEMPVREIMERAKPEAPEDSRGEGPDAGETTEANPRDEVPARETESSERIDDGPEQSAMQTPPENGQPPLDEAAEAPLSEKQDAESAEKGEISPEDSREEAVQSPEKADSPPEKKESAAKADNPPEAAREKQTREDPKNRDGERPSSGRSGGSQKGRGGERGGGPGGPR